MIDKSKLAGQKGHLLPPVTEKFKVRLASGTAPYWFHPMPSGPGFFHFIPGLASFLKQANPLASRSSSSKPFDLTSCKF